MKKVLFITNGTDPYWVDFYEFLFKENLYEIKIIFVKKQSSQKPTWNSTQVPFPHERLEDILKTGLWTRIQKFKKNPPDLIICAGYNHWFHWLMLLMALCLKSPFVLQGDSNILGEFKKTWLLKMIKRIFLCPMIHNASGFWVMGLPQRIYWQFYGASEKKFFDGGYYPVDGKRFNCSDEKHLIEPLKCIAENPDKKTLLFVGRFVNVKNLQMLIEAFNRIVRQTPTQLVLVGEGEEKINLEKIVREKKIPNIIFAGPVENKNLASLYSTAYCYIQPSLYEPAGIVIHEALMAGLPVIASDVCGYANTMLIHEWNGFVFRNGNVDDLTFYLKKILLSPEIRQKMSERGKEISQNWGYQRILRGLNLMMKDLTHE